MCQERLIGEILELSSILSSFRLTGFLALELDKESPYNWLDDNFWLKKAYLEWRTPLPVNSNWWLAYKNGEPAQQDTNPKRLEDVSDWAGITSWQIRRASWLLSRTLDFKDRLGRCGFPYARSNDARLNALSQELYPFVPIVGSQHPYSNCLFASYESFLRIDSNTSEAAFEDTRTETSIA